MNTMFIQVNTNSYLSAQNSNIASINANLVKDGNVCKEETEGGQITEEGPPAPEDDDLNISYNCETCNKPVKGKVMLQVGLANILCSIPSVLVSYLMTGFATCS